MSKHTLLAALKLANSALTRPLYLRQIEDDALAAVKRELAEFGAFLPRSADRFLKLKSDGTVVAIEEQEDGAAIEFKVGRVVWREPGQ